MRRFLSVSIAASLVALVLTGCMVPQWQKPGMPQAEVEKAWASPRWWCLWRMVARA